VLLLASGEDRNSVSVTPPSPMHTEWTKPGSYEIDWNKVNAQTQHNFALNAGGHEANKPVKGQLQVALDPGSTKNLPKTLPVYKFVPLVQSEKQFREVAASGYFFCIFSRALPAARGPPCPCPPEPGLGSQLPVGLLSSRGHLPLTGGRSCPPAPG